MIDQPVGEAFGGLVTNCQCEIVQCQSARLPIGAKPCRVESSMRNHMADAASNDQDIVMFFKDPPFTGQPD